MSDIEYRELNKLVRQLEHLQLVVELKIKALEIDTLNSNNDTTADYIHSQYEDLLIYAKKYNNSCYCILDAIKDIQKVTAHSQVGDDIPVVRKVTK